LQLYYSNQLKFIKRKTTKRKKCKGKIGKKKHDSHNEKLIEELNAKFSGIENKYLVLSQNVEEIIKENHNLKNDLFSLHKKFDALSNSVNLRNGINAMINDQLIEEIVKKEMKEKQILVDQIAHLVNVNKAFQSYSPINLIQNCTQMNNVYTLKNNKSLNRDSANLLQNKTNLKQNDNNILLDFLKELKPEGNFLGRKCFDH